MQPMPTAGRVLSVLVILAVLAGGLLVGLGAADATEELLNETVEVDPDTDPVSIAVEYSDDFNDSETDVSTVEATFYNETEFNTSDTDAPVLHSVSIDGGETERIVEDVYFEDHADLEYNESTRLVVTGDETHVSGVEIDGAIGGVLAYGDADSLPGFGVGVAVLALAVAGVVARARGGN
ncbi:hypothetical protein ACLI4U_17240 [Natrialbaceae archaeon A-CW2]